MSDLAQHTVWAILATVAGICAAWQFFEYGNMLMLLFVFINAYLATLNVTKAWEIWQLPE